MRRFIDFHTHSNASDGSFSPGEIVRLAEKAELAAVAITDHDTVAGLAEASNVAEEFPLLRLVCGIEVSACFSPGTLHIVALGIDEKSPSVHRLGEKLISARQERNPKIISALQSLGMRIDMDDVLKVVEEMGGDRDGGFVSRVHIATALCEKGYVRNNGEAFERFISDGAPAYIDKERLSPSDVISMIRSAGGLAVLAHPPQLRCENDAQLETVIKSFVDAGLEGIEVWHRDNSSDNTRRYLELAKKYGLMTSGGSDFHGSAKRNVKLGRPRVPLAAIDEKFRERIFRDRCT